MLRRPRQEPRKPPGNPTPPGQNRETTRTGKRATATKENKKKKTNAGAGLGRGVGVDNEVRVEGGVREQDEETQGEPQTPFGGFGFPQRLREEKKERTRRRRTNQTKRRRRTQTNKNHTRVGS